MAELKPKYATRASVTVTMAGLASAAWRQSAVVDNTTNRYLDALLGGSIQVGTSPTNGGAIRVWAYGQWDTNKYTGGASGSDAAYTADGEEDEFRLLHTITVDATSDQDYEFGPVSVAQAFGGVLPDKWGIVVENATGVALNATGTNNLIRYQGVTLESV